MAQSIARSLRETLRRALPAQPAERIAFVALGGVCHPLQSSCSVHSGDGWRAYTTWRQLTSLRNFSAAPRRPSPPQDAVRQRAADQGRWLVALVVGMVGLTYASVPLYRMFCQATGFGGTVQEGRSVEEKLRRREEQRDAALEAAAAARELTINFNADVADGMPWRFTPTQRAVKVRPGQSTLAFYTAQNLSDAAITGVSTYNVTPQQAGQYFNKVQCFCFEEQRLRGGERVDMPVFFYIDPEFAADPRMKGITSITLSYTFFKVTEEEEEAEAAVGAAVAPMPAATPAAAQ